ncbi:MAG: DUF11 domain-containing protein [Pseudobutyrivibrio sp.]|nr:DUF11 domain-containing protein [Pseudobutyrivibrio sp.]
MKKRVITALLVASILFHAVSTDFVSLAGDLEDITVEQSEETEAEENQVVEEEEIQTEEVVEDEIADDEDTTSEKINTETDNVEKESVTEPEEVMPEAEITETKEESDQDEEVEFSQDKEVGGVSISLSANPGVLPEGAYFEAKEISSADKLSKMEESIVAELPSSKKVADIKAFDITIYNADGNEIQPDTSKGNVKVSFKNSELGESISDSKTDVEVFHVADSMASAEAVSSSAGGDEVEFEAEHFSPYAVVSIEDNKVDNTKEIDENALINDVNIYKVDSSNNKVELTADGDNVISKDDTIRVEYTFKPMSIVVNPGDEEYAEYNYVYSGKSYKIPGIPKDAVRPDGGEIIVTNGEKDLGTITFDGEGNATLKIADFSQLVEKAENAKAGFDLKLNISGEGDGHKSSYELSFGETKITVNVDEYMPKAPTVKKTASNPDDNGIVTWNVTLKNDGNPIQYADGYSFTDTFSPGQDYVANSFKVDGVASTIAANNGSKLTWKYKNNDPNKEIHFTYQTKMDLLANLSKNNEGGSAEAKVTNKVEVTAPASEKYKYKALNISDTASSTYTKTLEQWIAKNGGNVDENGKATWEVTIQNNGFNVYDVVLTDKIIADTGVEITVDKVKVVNGSNEEVPSTSFTRTYNNNTQIFNFGEMSGTQKYVVTYETQIKDFNQYIKENHAIPKNEATISYKYKKGDGTEAVIPEGPTVGKNFVNNNVLIPKAAIEKEAKGYDASTHKITWDVTVNKSRQALTDVKVKDILPSDNKFVSISNVKVGDTLLTSSDYSINTTNARNVEFTFGNLDKKVLTFTVITELTDNAVWASNKTKSYENEVDLYYGSDDKVKASDKATQACVSNVISKSAGQYNYDERIIPYTIVVDTNNMPMDEVVVTDKLDTRLEYVEDSANGATAEYNEATNTLTFKLNAISAEQTITFKAKVKDGETFNNTG